MGGYSKVIYDCFHIQVKSFFRKACLSVHPDKVCWNEQTFYSHTSILSLPEFPLPAMVVICPYY